MLDHYVKNGCPL